MNSELLRVVEQEAEAERKRIIEEAQAQAQAIVAQAEAQAETMRQEFRRRAEAEEAEALAKAQSAANLEAQAALLSAKSRAMDMIFEQSLAAMKDMSPSKRKPVLKALIHEAAHLLGSEIRIRVAPDEVGLASDIVKELNLKADVFPDETVEGGVIASNASGSSLVFNRFSDRLSQARPRLLSEISHLLWGANG